MSQRSRRIILAALGGLLATGVDVCVLATFAERGAPIGLAAFVGALAGAVVGFTFSKYVAFRDPRPLHWHQVRAYALVSMTTAVFMAAAMFVLCDLGHVPYLVGKAIAAVAVFALWSYPAQRRRVFAALS